jgi:hypothetical protein
MGFLDFMRPPAYKDPALGVLVRQGRYWRGMLRLGSTSGVALLVAGPRTAPDGPRLGLARELGDRYTALRPAVERALFEHYEPYADAADPDVPRLQRPDQVWAHVAPVRARIEPLGGVETVEIAYRTDWDTEHTVGARFQGWVLTELNGSVV